MSAMRILYAINSMEGGGTVSNLPAILAALCGAGAEVRCAALTRRNAKGIAPIEAAGFPVVVRDGGERDHFAAYRWLKREARAFGATHIFTSLTRATLLGQQAGRALGLPVVSWQHNAFLKPWNERLLRWLAHRSALWVADSELVAGLTHTRLGVPRGRLVIWPIFFADPDTPQAAPWQEGAPVRVGSLGRLHPAKGYDVLIAALAILRARGITLPELDMTIAGEGGQRSALEAVRDRASLDLPRFIGFVDDPAAWLASLHLYLQPSRREGFCIAAHEAMAAGLPVIVSDTGEMPLTVDMTMGRVVPVEDANALAEALADMLADPSCLAEIGEAARERVLGKFSRERFISIGAQIVDRMRAL
ncbi:MAG: glycosyltransferase [Alteraurantiacibacter sp.]